MAAGRGAVQAQGERRAATVAVNMTMLIVSAWILAAARTCQADSGTATYYTTYTPSACYGFDTSPFPAGNLIAAASSTIYAGGAACGRMYQIACVGNGCTGGGPITVKIVDLCPGCAANQFDLSYEAFAAIADPNVGRININYNQLFHKIGGSEAGMKYVISIEHMASNLGLECRDTPWLIS